MALAGVENSSLEGGEPVSPVDAGSSPLAGKPRWLKVPAATSPEYLRLRALVRNKGLHTVCEEATCPNIGQCWREGSAAFMILGRLCTRACRFCNVTTGRPAPPDLNEPARLATAAQAMGLRHVVITSVSRDDLPDGGSSQFAACMTALRSPTAAPAPTIELLTPDFRNKPGALERLFQDQPPEVFNHNVETVPRLYATVRPAADYRHSLEVLRRAALLRHSQHPCATKSGLLLGLGETLEEVTTVLEDLRSVGVTLLTLGQYLRPSLEHHPVVTYWEPEVFAGLKDHALTMGFLRVESHPLARSSFHAAALDSGAG